MKRLLVCIILICAGEYALAQQKTVKYDLLRLLADKKITLVNREASAVVDGLKTGIKLSARDDDGFAWLDGVSFADGTIELDIKGKDVLQHSFVGIAFHGADTGHLAEVIYFRPFNFRAADPVRKIHAVQYVSLPKYDWEYLRENFNGQYEKGIESPPKADEWFHAKIVVAYPQVSVYVNGNPQPSLTVKMLGIAKTGKLGLWVGNTSDGEFANLTVTE